MTPDQITKLNEVHAAIVGNKQLGQKGLAERIDSLETYRDEDKAFKNKTVGGLSILTLIGGAISGFIAKHL